MDRLSKISIFLSIFIGANWFVYSGGYITGNVFSILNLSAIAAQIIVLILLIKRNRNDSN